MTSGEGGVRSTVAYFSMEICLEQDIPTYSGGLGVLAGDTLRSAADLGVPLIAVTLLHRKGYFVQHLDEHGPLLPIVRAFSHEDRYPRLGEIAVPTAVMVGSADRTTPTSHSRPSR